MDFKMFKHKYRIKAIMSSYYGVRYSAEVKLWWWPFWLEIDRSNKSDTQAGAEKWVSWHKNHYLYINDAKEIK
jgi:hypothetical protein